MDIKTVKASYFEANMKDLTT